MKLRDRTNRLVSTQEENKNTVSTLSLKPSLVHTRRISSSNDPTTEVTLDTFPSSASQTETSGNFNSAVYSTILHCDASFSSNLSSNSIGMVVLFCARISFFFGCRVESWYCKKNLKEWICSGPSSRIVSWAEDEIRLISKHVGLGGSVNISEIKDTFETAQEFRREGANIDARESTPEEYQNGVHIDDLSIEENCQGYREEAKDHREDIFPIVADIMSGEREIDDAVASSSSSSLNSQAPTAVLNDIFMIFYVSFFFFWCLSVFVFVPFSQ